MIDVMQSRQLANCSPPSPTRDAADVDRAVAAARASFEKKTWRGLDPSKRERILWNIGDLLVKHRDELATTDLPGERQDAARGRRRRRRARRRLLPLLRRLGAQDLRRDHPGGRPVPQLHAARTGRRGRRDRAVEFSVADRRLEGRARLACGCSVVLKPSELTPLNALRFAEICTRGGPARRRAQRGAPATAPPPAKRSPCTRTSTRSASPAASRRRASCCRRRPSPISSA